MFKWEVICNEDGTFVAKVRDTERWLDSVQSPPMKVFELAVHWAKSVCEACNGKCIEVPMTRIA